MPLLLAGENGGASQPVKAAVVPRQPNQSGRQPVVTLAEFLRRLAVEIAQYGRSPVLSREFSTFARRHGLAEGDPALRAEYAAVRLVYEATRAYGLWWLRWDVTDQAPTSRRIWRQWQTAAVSRFFHQGSAVAECDELSALFSFLARKLGVKHAGLFWPVSNHTIAVWTAADARGTRARIPVPTSFVFLSYSDQFDRIALPAFNPNRSKAIYDFLGVEVPDSFALPGAVAEFLLEQIHLFAQASQDTLHFLAWQRRTLLESAGLSASVSAAVRAYREKLARSGAAPAELAALDAFLLQIGTQR